MFGRPREASGGVHSAYITIRALRCVQVALIETQLTRMRDEAQRHATQAQHAQAEAEQRSSEHQAHVSRAAASQSYGPCVGCHL